MKTNQEMFDELNEFIVSLDNNKDPEISIFHYKHSYYITQTFLSKSIKVQRLSAHSRNAIVSWVCSNSSPLIKLLRIL